MLVTRKCLAPGGHSMAHRVLVIEDNHDIAELVKLSRHDCKAGTDIDCGGSDGLVHSAVMPVTCSSCTSCCTRWED